MYFCKSLIRDIRVQRAGLHFGEVAMVLEGEKQQGKQCRREKQCAADTRGQLVAGRAAVGWAERAVLYLTLNKNDASPGSFALACLQCCQPALTTIALAMRLSTAKPTAQW